MPLVDLDFLFETKRDRQRSLFEEEAVSERVLNPQLSDNEKIIVALLSDHSDKTIDNLAGEAKMSAAEVFKIVSVLDLRGIVFQSCPGRYGLRD
jgi:predicted Rossmann fold nucleotide-binding protein DprA/Smf involved in DNA uptake